MSNEEPIQWLVRWRHGDEEAATLLFLRYYRRLTLLARSRLSRSMRRRIDPQDVVQSALRSFFLHAQTDRFHIHRDDDLWRVLATFTIHHVLRQVEFHQAGRRDFHREQTLSGNDFAAQQPPYSQHKAVSVAADAEIAEELETFAAHLGPDERRVLELHLQNCSREEIANLIHRSTRTVRRILERVEYLLTERILSAS
jgi:RNA polymerase sigma factor (sigma-70 family)